MASAVFVRSSASCKSQAAMAASVRSGPGVEHQGVAAQEVEDSVHIVGWADDGVHILDIWDSPADFQAFFEARILPVIQAAGIETQPDVKMYDLHGVYAPAFGQTAQVASV